MKTITQEEIGKRVAKLRKSKGYSQEVLARLIGVSRPSLTQIELGKRTISVIELIKISEGLSISTDKFLSPTFNLYETFDDEKLVMEDPQIRVSIPELKTKKFKNILLYMLERCAGKPNIGETILNKLLYFSDFNYYELYEEQMSGAEYRKLPYGPVPQMIDIIINQMIEEKQLKRFITEYYGYPQTRYIPLVKPDLSGLNANEKNIIDRVIDQYSDWTAAAISNYSHKDMPWLASKDGEIIDYELVFYREPPYSVRNYDETMDVS